jgi:hypothetical protein
MTKPTPTGPRSFAERFESVDDAVPLSVEEAKAILADAGIDPAEGMKRLFAEMDSIDAAARQKRFANAEVSRQRELSRLEKGFEGLGRAELLQQLDIFRTSHPELRANFRSFQGASDDELRSLLAELQELIRRDDEK